MFGLGGKDGWTGIDAGASTVKLAQVVRRGGRPVVARAAIVPRPAAWLQGVAAGSSLPSIESLLAMAGGGNRRRAAATLSMSQCDVAAERAELVPTATADACWGEWQADPQAGDEGWFTLTADQDATATLCDDLRRAGLSCRSIDATPHALARAVELGAPSSRGRTLAALDWSHSGALFCSVRDGEPVYVRRLKGCGLDAFDEALSEAIGIDRAQTLELLMSTQGDHANHDITELVDEVARPIACDLADQLARTIGHLRSHRKGVAPEHIYLFGGGATLGAEKLLGERCETHVSAWTLPGAPPATGVPLALIGPAVAASALAWEGI